ncbi:hypothetical protein HGA91_04105 [candidate division WWE3 bacterium]|nr:hypothetical protein [candidate division WWE3 bacterium]
MDQRQKVHGPYLGVSMIVVSNQLNTAAVTRVNSDTIDILVAGATQHVWVDTSGTVLFINKAFVPEEQSQITSTVTITDNAVVTMVAGINTGTIAANFDGERMTEAHITAAPPPYTITIHCPAHVIVRYA